MKRESTDNILMSIVGCVFLLNMLLLRNLLVRIDPVFVELVVLGWIILIVGALFVTLSIITLRRKGTTNFTDSGVYGVVRHPMYLGGMLMFVSHPFFGQHWAVLASTLLGVYCCYLIVKSEDKRIIEKFGGEYELYMQRVPRLNFMRGVVRILRLP